MSCVLAFRRCHCWLAQQCRSQTIKYMPYCKTVKHYEDLFAVRRTALLDKPAVPPVRSLALATNVIKLRQGRLKIVSGRHELRTK
jgi:hypothetical protein